MNAQVKRKPTKTRNAAAVMNPVAQAVQLVELQKAQVVIMKMDKCIEELTMQRDQFDHAACIMSDMLTELDKECNRLRNRLEWIDIAEHLVAEKDKEIEALKSGAVPADVSALIAKFECAKADLRAAQAKIKRLEHSADYWRDAWVKADKNADRLALMAGLLCVWGAL